MADFTIVNEELTESHVGQRGFREYRALVAFPTTAATATLPLLNISQIDNVQVSLAGTPATPATVFGDSVGTVAATTAFTTRVPKAGTITSAAIIVQTTVATDDTNYWSVGIINRTTGAGTAVVADVSAAANTNKVTGGAAFTADTLRSLTLTATAADLVVAAGDELEFTFTKASSAANLVSLEFSVVMATGDSSEQVYWVPDSAPTSGPIPRPSTGKLTFGRTGSSKTSALRCSIRVTGR